jgi:serine/threonine protein kinase
VKVILGEKYCFSSDIWSIRVVNYELMAFWWPFPHENQLLIAKFFCLE